MFETKTPKEVITELESDFSNGLSSEEAKKRLEKNGPNKLQEKKKKPLILVFLEQFNNPMIYVLLGAAAVSLGISIYNACSGLEADWIDIIIILAVVVLNSIIGTVQESKAEKSLEALKKLASPLCNVKRDGKIISIKSEDLVVGDVVVLEEGQNIPADIRLIESSNLKTDESSLTGESLPIEKDASFILSKETPLAERVNMVYMGTPIVYGHGEGVVTGTGMNTEIGKIANMLSGEEDNQTPLQKKLASLSKFIGLVVIGCVLIIFIVQLIQILTGNRENFVSQLLNSFISSVAVAVAAVPEGLPAVVTIVLALGVQKMAGVNTIVRKLPSVETLGAVSIVCSDKTGTLTQNKMTVVEVFTRQNSVKIEDINDNDFDLLATGMALCSNASIDNGVHGDPTEIALVEFAKRLDICKENIEKSYQRIDELPFDSVRKMMSTLNIYKGKKIQFTKGAIDSIIANCTHIMKKGEICKITKEDIDEINNINDDMSNRALRVLALAIKETESIEEKGLTFVGLTAMIDPPRPEAKNAVAIFKKAGIRTIMITGDHKVTALAIAKQLGIANEDDIAMSGAEIDKLDEKELVEVVKNVSVFARVSPENKVQIVKAIKSLDIITAMTGDGVNDAPSLKIADIGIAMGKVGTDVAKNAAEMILADDNFASIEKAVEEGRGIFANIRKTVLFLLSSNISEVLIMFISIVLGFGAPLTTIHLLWVNLVTDSLPAVALGADDKEDGIMNEKPRDPNESLFAHGGYAITFGFGLVITIAVFIAFLLPAFENNAFSFIDIKNLYANDRTIMQEAQTLAFVVLSFCELFHMIGMTSFKKSFVHVFKTKNWLLLLSFVIGVILTVGVVLIPGLNEVFNCYRFNDIHWLWIVLLSLSPLIVHEIVVLIGFLKRKRFFKKH